MKAKSKQAQYSTAQLDKSRELLPAADKDSVEVISKARLYSNKESTKTLFWEIIHISIGVAPLLSMLS